MKIKPHLSKLHPKRVDQAKLFGVRTQHVDSKINTIENKIKWLRENLKPLGLTIKIEKS